MVALGVTLQNPLGQINIVLKWHLVSPHITLWNNLVMFQTSVGFVPWEAPKRLEVVSRMTLCNWAMNHIEAMGIKALDFKKFAFKLCFSWALMDLDLINKSSLDGSKRFHVNLCVMECANI